MKTLFIVLMIYVIPIEFSNAQELFPLSESASTMPQGVLGVRTQLQYYKQGQVGRYMAASRFMYGITSKLTSVISVVGSNHHDKKFPESFWLNHSHYFTTNYAFQVNGLHLYLKYRIISIDGKNSHFRTAVYAEGSQVWSKHDEAETNLFDDNSGYGFGVISTYLKERFAVSFTGGLMKATTYYDRILDPIPSLPFVPLKMEYKPAYNFDLSFGYLLLPRKYKSYSQLNWNIYLELKGRHYSALDIHLGHPITSDDQPIDYYYVTPKSTPYLQKGNYVDANYGLQCIVKSNLRIDFSVGSPLIGKSLVHTYPYFQIGVQRSFY